VIGEKRYCIEHGFIDHGEIMISNGNPSCPYSDDIVLLLTEVEWLEATGQSDVTESIIPGIEEELNA
jgi:hypothetical protein